MTRGGLGPGPPGITSAAGAPGGTVAQLGGGTQTRVAKLPPRVWEADFQNWTRSYEAEHFID